MFNRAIVQKALKKSWKLDFTPKLKPKHPISNLDSVTSLVIYDIFGGEILKTPKKNGWHFYNRIDGKRVDFIKSDMIESSKRICFKDILSNPEEVCNYFDTEDYSTLRRKFIREYEEVIGLNKYSKSVTV